MICKSARSDPQSAADAYGKPRQMLGLSASNRPVYAPYRPSVLSMATDFTHLAASPEIQPEAIIPVLDGWSFAKNADTNQTQVAVDPFYARDSNESSATWGEITLSDVAKVSVLLTPMFFSSATP